MAPQLILSRIELTRLTHKPHVHAGASGRTIVIRYLCAVFGRWRFYARAL